MKTLKFSLLGIIGLIALILLIAFFTKKDYVVEKETTINKPKAQVFEYIKYLKNQDNYSKWNKMDADMKKEYKGSDGNVGFVSAWDSEKTDVGKGEQEIIKIVENENIDMEIRFKKPFESTCFASLVTEAISENQTRVKWIFHGNMSYPMNIMLLFMDMNKAIGGDLEIGLSNLKTILEK